jgi:dTDP-4-amino-4,6-dideoxygalactose transaminase
MINLFQPSAGDAELAAIGEVFASNWLGTGRRAEQFEQAFGEYVGRSPKELLAITSCTEGLFQAVSALGLGRGDDVVLPAISFIGAAHAVRNAGARVVLSDVDPVTLNPTVNQIAEALTPTTRAVLILHYGGGLGEAAAIAELASQRSLSLIEDAACGLGTFADGRACGTFGDIGVWSFDSMKVMTTGDGGMVWCRSAEIADRIRSSIRLGVDSSGFGRRTDSSRWWEIDPQSVGRRSAMNDVAASMGLAQLERLPDFLRRRHEIAASYDAGLEDVPWVSVSGRVGSSARTFYWIQTTPALRDKLAVHMLERGVYSSFRYWPLHKTRMYESGDSFPGADHAAESTLMLPLHQGLVDADVEKVLEAIHAFDPQRLSR